MLVAYLEVKMGDGVPNKPSQQRHWDRYDRQRQGIVNSLTQRVRTFVKEWHPVVARLVHRGYATSSIYMRTGGPVARNRCVRAGLRALPCPVAALRFQIAVKMILLVGKTFQALQRPLICQKNTCLRCSIAFRTHSLVELWLQCAQLTLNVADGLSHGDNALV